jgi:hypothetical protein
VIVGLVVFFDRLADVCGVTFGFQEMRVNERPGMAMIVSVMRMKERIGNERDEHRADAKTRTEPSHHEILLYALPVSQPYP